VKSSMVLKALGTTFSVVAISAVGAVHNDAFASGPASSSYPALAPHRSTFPTFPHTASSAVSTSPTTLASGGPTSSSGTVTPYNINGQQIANVGISSCMSTLGYPQGYDVYQYYTCNGSANQTFNFLSTSTAYVYQLQTQASNNGGCIDNYGNTGANNVAQVWEPCVNAGNEQYLAYNAGVSGEPHEAYLIDSQNLCLTSTGNANNPVEQYTCVSGNGNQIWNLVPFP